MSENTEREYNQAPGQDFVKVISVDPQRLRFVKVVSVDARIRVVGVDKPQITVRADSGAVSFLPQIEFSRTGEEVEISAKPGRGFNFRFDFENPPFDPDARGDWNWNQGDYDAGDERNRREYTREERRKAREEYRQNAREERERIKNEQRQRIFNIDIDPSFISNLGEWIDRAVQSVIGIHGEIYVEVPPGVDVEVKSVSGSIEVSNIRGFSTVKSTSGSIQLQDMPGGVQLKNMSGKVEGIRLGGEFNAKMTSGALTLRDCRFRELDVTNTSGYVMVETALDNSDNEDFRLNNVSGTIQLRLQRNSRATVECRSLSGRIQIQPEIGWVQVKNRPGQSQSRVELNGGGRKIMLNTVSGKIDVGLYDQPEEVKPVSWPPAPPEPPTPPTPFEPKEPPRPGDWPSARPVEPVMRQEPVQEVAPQEGQSAGTGNWPAAENNPAEQSSGEDRKTRQLEILRAIERGEISVEDGLARLSELEDN
jgi:DUF4097 and DUF4098 domain-containing protein YvlB